MIQYPTIMYFLVYVSDNVSTVKKMKLNPKQK